MFRDHHPAVLTSVYEVEGDLMAAIVDVVRLAALIPRLWITVPLLDTRFGSKWTAENRRVLAVITYRLA